MYDTKFYSTSLSDIFNLNAEQITFSLFSRHLILKEIFQKKFTPVMTLILTFHDYYSFSGHKN